MQVTDLVRYNHVVRGLYFDAMTKLPWSEGVKPRGASFDSGRNVFLHLTLVEDRWLGYIIPGRFRGVDLDFEAFKGMDDLKSYMDHVKDAIESYLKDLLAGQRHKSVIAAC